MRDVALSITSHVQTQNRVCNFHFFIWVWLLSRDRLLLEFLFLQEILNYICPKFKAYHKKITLETSTFNKQWKN